MRHPQPVDYLILFTLALLWGSSFSLIKVTVETIPPLTAAAGRIIIGAVLLGAVAALRGERFPTKPGIWLMTFFVGILGNSLPFFLINWGETAIDAGVAAILISFVPIFTLLIAHFFTRDEKLSRQKLIGVGVGFGGIVLLVGPGAMGGLGSDLVHQLALLGAAACYAVTGLIARQLAGHSRLCIGTMALGFAGVVSLSLALFVDQPWNIHPGFTATLAVILQGIFPTALATLLLLRLVANTGVHFLASNNYLVPVIGVFIGVIWLGEEVSQRMIGALIVIFIGIGVSNIRLKSKA